MWLWPTGRRGRGPAGRGPGRAGYVPALVTALAATLASLVWGRGGKLTPAIRKIKQSPAIGEINK